MVCLYLAFCVLFWFSLDYFVLVLFDFVMLGLVSSASVLYAKTLARKNISEITYFVLCMT